MRRVWVAMMAFWLHFHLWHMPTWPMCNPRMARALWQAWLGRCPLLLHLPSARVGGGAQARAASCPCHCSRVAAHPPMEPNPPTTLLDCAITRTTALTPTPFGAMPVLAFPHPTMDGWCIIMPSILPRLMSTTHCPRSSDSFTQLPTRHTSTPTGTQLTGLRMSQRVCCRQVLPISAQQ